MGDACGDLLSAQAPSALGRRGETRAGRDRAGSGRERSGPRSKQIAGEPVGLLPIDNEVWELYYGPVLLAQVTLKNKQIQLMKQR